MSILLLCKFFIVLAEGSEARIAPALIRYCYASSAVGGAVANGSVCGGALAETLKTAGSAAISMRAAIAAGTHRDAELATATGVVPQQSPRQWHGCVAVPSCPGMLCIPLAPSIGMPPCDAIDWPMPASAPSPCASSASTGW